MDGPYSRWDPTNAYSNNSPPAHGAPEPYDYAAINWSSGQVNSLTNWAMRHAGGESGNLLTIDGRVDDIRLDLATPLAQRQYLFKKLNDY
jgi:hypothetical protein